MKLKLLDLFSGIGGFSLGLESTGYFETIAFVEKNEFCQKVLKKNFPNITIESEVRDVKGEKYKADVVTSGFPCQPFSFSGKRKGKNDDRYLWDETIRVIKECKCKWFIGENVEGIINISNGTILQQIQQDLEKEGFQVQCVVIPASGVGAWHQRKRVWIIANSNNENVPNTNLWNVETRCERQRGICSKEKGQRATNIFTTICETLPHTQSQGTWFEIESKLCGIPNELSSKLDKDRNNRLKALGNSIVPLIARELGLAIMKAENDEKI